MFDLEYFQRLKKCECLDNIQLNKFRKMYSDKNGKTCDFYTNNDIRNIINKANNQYKIFKKNFKIKR